MLKNISTLFLVCGAITLSGADSINDQIEAIKRAAPQERVELMNRLKVQIAAMNEEERALALENLQTNMGNAGVKIQNRFRQGHMGEGSGTMQQLRLRSGETPRMQQGRQ